ncbi:MAG: GYD domain-containing protein [Candidatus Hydrogenedentes bacterium]|nr:GYD domain-containing protein [Candidatus Hydrogenedentota bacterium]
MATYFMFGRYSADAVKQITAARTKRAAATIKKLGGQVRAIYALLGQHDLVLIADLPGTQEAVRASIALSRLTGIAFSTAPAMPVEEFDELVSKG